MADEATEYPPLTPEEIRCIDAEASEHEALAAKAKAEARLHNAMADVAEIELRARQFRKNWSWLKIFTTRPTCIRRRLTKSPCGIV